MFIIGCAASAVQKNRDLPIAEAARSGLKTCKVSILYKTPKSTNDNLSFVYLGEKKSNPLEDSFTACNNSVVTLYNGRKEICKVFIKDNCTLQITRINRLFSVYFDVKVV